ncbi:MAG: restriction endonuclease subunit R, partial [Bacilli bacterium]|nr:restriction endonuclease subunit R [Bacilli bacterium]
SLSGNSRAVFEYFIGYKLGLTATPKNYLKNLKVDENDIREIERRKLLDTYHTFGCDSGNPTFSYTLKDGVEDKILVNPIIVDARTDITTELLSKEGLIVKVDGDESEIVQEVNSLDYGKEEQIFNAKSFERKFFSDETNRVLCETFMKNALRDPITNEIGKSIIFCVNRKHAVKVTEILNQISEAMYPNKYNSDFAVQITSNIPLAQDMTISFANNNLNGKTKFIEDYESSKTRIAVTVGMMTTGYDCRDILNVGLFRPIYSPSEFIQIKGRGTRIYDFKYEDIKKPKKTFKLFDYFAVCEFFEKDYKYDEVLKLPKITQRKDILSSDIDNEIIKELHIKYTGKDELCAMEETPPYIMKIDKEYYTDFETMIKNDEQAKLYIDSEDVENLTWYIKENIFDKPNEYYNPQNLSTKLGLDRRLTVREIVEKILGYIPGFKTKKELLENEFDNFKLLNKDELSEYADKIGDIKMIFEAYITDRNMREYMKEGRFNDLINSPLKEPLKSIVNIKLKNRTVIKYIVDYVLENDINCDKFVA